MRVTFRRFPDHSSAYSVIERDDGVVYRMKEFTRAGTELPHDLRHFVVERELGIADGIWGGIAAAWSTRAWTTCGACWPPHSAERSDELQRAQRQPLMRAELLANLVEAIAMLDDPSGDDIRRLTRTKLSAVPVTEPGADPADVAAVPPPEVLAGGRGCGGRLGRAGGGGTGLRVAARCPGRSHPRAASHEQARPAVTYPFMSDDLARLRG